MTDDRDICERLEDTNYDGAFAMRQEAAKIIRGLRYYADRLEDNLREVGSEAERFREHVAKQQLDIITLGQEVGRLREALEKIADDGNATGCNPQIMCNTARAALGEEKKS